MSCPTSARRPRRTARARWGALVASALLAVLAAATAFAQKPADSSATAGQAARPRRTGPSSGRIYLAWHAPYGEPGASEAISPACGDTSTKDTLYMTFDPGRDAEQFLGLTATLYFWSGAGDTLSAPWWFGNELEFRGLEVRFNPDSVPGAPRPWPEQNVARAGYSWTRGSGKLRMIVAVGMQGAQPVSAGKRYVLARLLVPRPARRTPGCDQPICVEWAEARLSFGYEAGDSEDVNRGGRFVAWNSPGGRVCAPMRRFATPPWEPPLLPGPKRRK